MGSLKNSMSKQSFYNLTPALVHTYQQVFWKYFHCVSEAQQNAFLKGNVYIYLNTGLKDVAASVFSCQG